MTTLAIETATGSVGAALADETGLIAAFEVRAGRRHAELLHGVVRSVLDAVGIDFGDLDSIAVDVGPGLFTGIRVGVAAAKGFAMALGVPVVGITSLEILARACQAAGHGCSIGVVDLRRGEVAWALPGAPGRPQMARHGPPEVLAVELTKRLGEGAGTDGAGRAAVTTVAKQIAPAERIVLAGDGARRYSEILTAGHGSRVTVAGAELAVPPVASLALGGVAGLREGRAIDPLEIRPEYLREADVRINWSTRHDVPGQPGREA
jgi:tRNA threonylcarbamoyladenosine biosynthesis protein TsaB